jgi:hypothetical protein
MVSKKPVPRCVAGWLADPRDCWLAGGCKYFNKVLRRCEHVERSERERAEKEAEQRPNGSPPTP